MSKLKYSIYLNNTSNTFSNRGFEVILAIILALGSLGLMFFLPITGIALGIFSYGFLCIGTKSYLISIAKDENKPIESIFSKFRICIKAFCLKVATTLITFLWTLVFIIPGIVTALNYSMASFVMADEDLSVLESMNKSKKLVNGYRGEIFIIYLSYFFVTLAIMCICVGLGCAMRFYFNVQYWIPVVSMILLSMFFIVIFVIPYFELMLAHIYLVLKHEHENSKTNVELTLKSTSNSKRKTTNSVKNLNA